MSETPVKSTRRDGNRPARWLEALALFVLLMVVASRPLLSETYTSSLTSITRVVNDYSNLTPATTVWFDMSIWVAALLIVIAGVMQKRRWRWTGAETGGALLLVAAVVSSLAADNRRLAVNACGDWLTAIVLLMTLAQLCRCRRHLVLVLAVVVASGVASAARSVMQVAVEYKETSQIYHDSKEDFWISQGVRLDDPRVELYERRLASREATGFLAYSNAQGALLSMTAFAALALSRLCRTQSMQRLLLFLLALALFATIWTTGSKGAIGAVGLMALLWIGSGLLKRFFHPHGLRVWLGGWMVVIVLTLLIAGYGWARGGLPGASLNFRWHYWKVSARVIADHLWTGTGALNFDRAYLAHKPVIYPEEINDPHNFVISALAQGGVIGCAGLLVLIGGVSWVIAKRWEIEDGHRSLSSDEPADPLKISKWWLILIPIGFLFLRFWLLRGYLNDPLGGWAYIYFDLGSYGLIWIVTAMMIIRLVSKNGEIKPAAYRSAILFGGLGFLLQNTIDFSFFIPGPQMVFAALVALLLMGPGKQPPSSTGRLGLLAPLIVVVPGLLLFFMMVFRPVTRSSRLLEQARRSPAAEAGNLYLAAIQADPVDPTPWVEWASRQAQGLDYQSITRALETLDHAIALDSKDTALHRFQAQLYTFRYREAGGPNTDLLQAVAAGRRVVHLYPESPDGHVFLADLLTQAVHEIGRDDLRSQAIGHYREALRLDAERPAHEIRRWSAQRRGEIMKNLSALMITSSTPSFPAEDKHDRPPTED